MEDPIYDVGGAPVIFSDKPPAPKNPLYRPNINYKKFLGAIGGFIFTVFVTFILCSTGLSRFICEYISISEKICTVVLTCMAAVVYICIVAKRALIWLVHIYQHYAPDRVRLKCVFEPSCSEYMILCLKKYGVIKGVLKGVYRLLRCHPPNGGKDYP